MKLLRLTIFLMWFGHPATSFSDTLDDALSAYEDAMSTVDRGSRLAQFRQAENLFRKAIEEIDGRVSAQLFVNLGNAALEAERRGPAVVAYHRALETDPGNRQAQSNLAFIRSALPEWLQPDESNSLAESIFFWKSYFSQRGILLLTSIFFLAVCLLVAASKYWQKRFLMHLAVLPFCIWSVLILSLVFQSRQATDLLAVVVADEVIARAADSMTSPSRFSSPLPSGTELKIAESREGWYRVILADDQSAWVPHAAIEAIP